MPSLVLLEDVHLLMPTDPENPQQQPAPQSAAVLEWLCQTLDHLKPLGLGSTPLAGW